ncbi:hypothetical protein HYX18_03655 [Candidatus Woesearchaeota archaeon]|nr:hypothetical protein [Candidatus Woesearchaeota archaeon]
MGFLKLLKPTKNKVIISLLILFFTYIFLLFSQAQICKCALGGFEGCKDYGSLSLIFTNGCRICGCTSIGEIFLEYIYLLGPSLLFYLVFSLIEFKKKK